MTGPSIGGVDTKWVTEDTKLPGAVPRRAQRLGARNDAPMRRYLTEIWRARDFWFALVRSDLRNRYRGSVLGVGWSLLNPIAMTTLLCVMFSGYFKTDPWLYAPYLLIGLAIWNYLTACTLTGCQALRFAEGYIRQAPLPMAIYPLRTTLAAGFHFAMAGAVAVTLVASLHGLSWTLMSLCVLPALVMLFVLGWAIGTIGAFHGVRFSDAPHLLEVALQFVFLVTPIVYPAAVLHDRGRAWLLDANPIFHLLELFRRPLIDQAPPTVANVLVVGAVTSLLAGIAILTVRFQERRLIFSL